MKFGLLAFLGFCVSCCHDLDNDYEHSFAAKFWAEHRTGTSPLDADAAKLSVEQQYAIYRYGTEYFRPGTFSYEQLVLYGPRAVPLLRSKLRQLDDSWSVWTVAIVLEEMNGRTYNVASDPGLSADLWAAAQRARGPYSVLNKQIAQRIAPRH